MAREKGLSKQVQDVLDSKLKIGTSKHNDKKLGITDKYIYSWSTYRTYLKHGCYFVKWAKKEYGCRNLEEAKNYINNYLQKRIDEGLSPYTQKLESSALAKLYSCSTKDFIVTETRHRADIKRSRGKKVRDKHFSEKNNKDFVEFCKATGLRRSELKYLTKKQLFFDDIEKRYYLKIIGKGGRLRYSPIINQVAVDIINNSDENKPVWSKIPNGADIHSYRAIYATKMYKLYARSKNDIPKNERYCCRKDLKGIWYDKKAMSIVSKALGHNRISVIAGHYIRKED